MDQSLNVNVLVAKEEYTNQLITTTTNYFYDIIKQIYQESQLKNNRLDISYSNFQRDLKEVPNWSTYKLEEKLSKMNGGLPYLMDLITAIFVSHVKILACVRLKSDDKSIKIKVPTLNVFLHKITISISETIFYSPTIIHDDKSKLFDIIAKSIKDTIANQIPIQYILSEYLSGVFDEDEAQLRYRRLFPRLRTMNLTKNLNMKMNLKIYQLSQLKCLFLNKNLPVLWQKTPLVKK